MLHCWTKSVLPSPTQPIQWSSYQKIAISQNLQTLRPHKQLQNSHMKSRFSSVCCFCCFSPRHHGRTFHISCCSISAFFSKSFRTADLWRWCDHQKKRSGDISMENVLPVQTTLPSFFLSPWFLSGWRINLIPMPEFSMIPSPARFPTSDSETRGTW